MDTLYLCKNLSTGVGPKSDSKSHKSWLKILEFIFQVWINCEHQINKYAQPCGSLFAGVAEKCKKAALKSNSSQNFLFYPSCIFYLLGLEFGNNSDSPQNGRLAAGLSIFFIKWGEFLESVTNLDARTFINSFHQSLNYVTPFVGSDQPVFKALRTVLCDAEVSLINNRDAFEILGNIANAAENAALETSELSEDQEIDAGAHVVGITGRAIYQAYRNVNI